RNTPGPGWDVSAFQRIRSVRAYRPRREMRKGERKGRRRLSYPGSSAPSPGAAQALRQPCRAFASVRCWAARAGTRDAAPDLEAPRTAYEHFYLEHDWRYKR